MTIGEHEIYDDRSKMLFKFTIDWENKTVTYKFVNLGNYAKNAISIEVQEN